MKLKYRRGLPKPIILFCAIILIAGNALPAMAQQAVTSATLSGQVEDKDGAGISGATATATNLDRNQSWTTESDERGRFRFSLLPVGPYQIKVQHEGFATYSKELTLLVGQAIDLPVKLVVGNITESVNIISG